MLLTLKQADWVKISKREEMPQLEAEGKQASWVKMPKQEKIHQLEAKKEANQTSMQMLHR